MSVYMLEADSLGASVVSSVSSMLETDSQCICVHLFVCRAQQMSSQ